MILPELVDPPLFGLYKSFSGVADRKLQNQKVFFLRNPEVGFESATMNISAFRLIKLHQKMVPVCG